MISPRTLWESCIWVSVCCGLTFCLLHSAGSRQEGFQLNFISLLLSEIKPLFTQHIKMRSKLALLSWITWIRVCERMCGRVCMLREEEEIVFDKCQRAPGSCKVLNPCANWNLLISYGGETQVFNKNFPHLRRKTEKSTWELLTFFTTSFLLNVLPGNLTNVDLVLQIQQCPLKSSMWNYKELCLQSSVLLCCKYEASF